MSKKKVIRYGLEILAKKDIEACFRTEWMDRFSDEQWVTNIINDNIDAVEMFIKDDPLYFYNPFRAPKYLHIDSIRSIISKDVDGIKKRIRSDGKKDVTFKYGRMAIFNIYDSLHFYKDLVNVDKIIEDTIDVLGIGVSVEKELFFKDILHLYKHIPAVANLISKYVVMDSFQSYKNAERLRLYKYKDIEAVNEVIIKNTIKLIEVSNFARKPQEERTWRDSCDEDDIVKNMIHKYTYIPEVEEIFRKTYSI